MAKTKQNLTEETPQVEEEEYALIYNMWITIENHGTVNIRQQGRPPNPPPPPTGD